MGDMKDKATLCRAAQQSNIPFGVGATYQAGANSEASLQKMPLQKAASEPAIQQANIAGADAAREMNSCANHGQWQRRHTDFTYGQKRTQSQWRTCQVSASEQNLAAKYNCIKPADCKALQGVSAGEDGGVRISNMYWGNDTENLVGEKESHHYGRAWRENRKTAEAS